MPDVDEERRDGGHRLECNEAETLARTACHRSRVGSVPLAPHRAVTSVLDTVAHIPHARAMTSELDSSGASRGDRARTHAYLNDFLPGIVGYLAVLTLVVLFGNLDGTSPLRFLWAVLPVIPTLWCLRAVARHIGRIDDFQQRLLLQGLAVGFGVAMITAVTVGFLGIAGLDMRLAGWIIFAAGMLAWIVGAAVSAKR